VAKGIPAAFLISLIGLGSAITADVVPGVFSIDDNNYLINVLSLRAGRVTVPQTDGLPASPELLFFDPGSWTRAVTATPVASTAPPLYAPIALPFSFLGWRGLVALNTLAYLATALMLFVFVRQRSTTVLTPWLAAAAFALGGFSIEYAEGLWPHSLSVALCTAGLLASVRASETGSARFAGAGGALLALAAGVRYQNALILAVTAAWFLIRMAPRWKTIAVFALAAAIPLTASAAINKARLGSWNPISKGPGYLNVPEPARERGMAEPVLMFWARLVDYSKRPALTSRTFAAWQSRDPVSGANVMPGGIAKKAFLQSAPWALLGFAMLALSLGTASLSPGGRRPALILFSLVTAGVLGAFAVSGATRDDGFSFNQRYLLELVPLAAIAFAWSVDNIALRVRTLSAGAAIGMVAFFAAMVVIDDDTSRFATLMNVPLALAAAALVAWISSSFKTFGRGLLALLIGLCLGWALAVNLGEDLRGSHQARSRSLARTTALSSELTDSSVLVGYWYYKDAAVPLLFDRDLLILDLRADEGADAPVLIRELLRRGRRVVVLEDGIPAEVLLRAIGGFDSRPIGSGGAQLIELRLKSR